MYFKNGEKDGMEAPGVAELMKQKARELFRESNLADSDRFNLLKIWITARSRRLKLLRRQEATKRGTQK
jgi:hypothetical protein